MAGPATSTWVWLLLLPLCQYPGSIVIIADGTCACSLAEKSVVPGSIVYPVDVLVFITNFDI
ncbi:GL27347 [Drosophila persimilis]|uniref:GL27347 n=1 Tax=Drosophila persimilis TaxID=7234 RepID=B4GZE0_DROPE|nr:GL27347 [Drosophila persimilis]